MKGYEGWQNKWREARRQRQPRAAENGDHAGRQMKGGKAATAAKSSREWRSCRETNEGRQGGNGSQEQPRMEIMQGDKWREARRHRQPRAAQNGDHAGGQMKEDICICICNRVLLVQVAGSHPSLGRRLLSWPGRLPQWKEKEPDIYLVWCPRTARVDSQIFDTKSWTLREAQAAPIR